MGNRRDLLKTMALLPLAACTSDLNKMGGGEVQTDRLCTHWVEASGG